VPPPVRGNIHQTVRAVTVTTKPPVSQLCPIFGNVGHVI
jgi:hypothetical protein